jgi:hypothetical protein
MASYPSTPAHPNRLCKAVGTKTGMPCNLRALRSYKCSGYRVQECSCMHTSCLCCRQQAEIRISSSSLLSCCCCRWCSPGVCNTRQRHVTNTLTLTGSHCLPAPGGLLLLVAQEHSSTAPLQLLPTHSLSYTLSGPKALARQRSHSGVIRRWKQTLPPPGPRAGAGAPSCCGGRPPGTRQLPQRPRPTEAPR